MLQPRRKSLKMMTKRKTMIGNASTPKGHARIVYSDRRTRNIFIWSLSAGLVISGMAFALKIAEFIFTMSSDDAKGFADVPVTVYFFVAGGWLCLLLWCFITGKFKDVEYSKMAMLEQEEEYAKQGI